MPIFHSVRASPKENWSITLDVNLSSACDTVLILWNDLWPDGFLAWGYFYKGQTLALRKLRNCLEHFWQWALRVEPVWTPPSFWHQNCGLGSPSSLLPKLQIWFRLSLVLVSCSFSPFKKGDKGNWYPFWKLLTVKLLMPRSPWEGHEALRGELNGNFPNWCFLVHNNKRSL